MPRIGWLEDVAEAVLDAIRLMEYCRQHRLSVETYELRIPALTEVDRVRLKQCIALAEELTGIDSLVTRSLKTGFAVHYGGIPQQLRNAMAPLIQRGTFSLVIATSTIIHGVNTPARTVLIHSLVRPDDWTSEISPYEFMNLVGRAGRAMQETEGIALICTETTKASRVRRSIERYVSDINSSELKSSLRAFLNRVVDQWRQSNPGANVGELCDRLASQHIDWFDNETQHKMDVLDRELLALLQESDTTASTVEELFERSLLVLQSVGDNDLWHGQQTSLSLLAA